MTPKFKRDSIKTILAETGENRTIVISTHLLRDLDTVFDEIIILKKDRIVHAVTDDIRADGKSVEQFYLDEVEK